MHCSLLPFLDEVRSLKDLLGATPREDHEEECKDAIRKMLAESITVDYVKVYIAVLKLLRTTNVELKQLIYQFAFCYGRQLPDSMILVANSLLFV